MSNQQSRPPRLLRGTVPQELSSPEQLDEAIALTSPFSWLSTVALIFATLAALAWGFLGTVHTRVQGDGLITYHGARLHQVVSHGSGYLKKLVVEADQTIAAGDVVAILDSPSLKSQVDASWKRIVELENELRLARQQRGSAKAQLEAENRERAAEIETSIVEVVAAKAYLERLLQEMTADPTRVDPVRLAEKQEKILDADRELRNLTNSLQELHSNAARRLNQWKEQLEEAEVELESHRRKAARLAESLAETVTVRATITGAVTEILASPGAYLEAGDPILHQLDIDAFLFTQAFLPVNEAKLVKPGMEVRIAPSTVRKEEFGTITGVVENVSRFPMSPEALMGILQNSDLVEQFTRDGAPLMVRIMMKTAPNPTGFEWSSGTPPPLEITPGTPAEVTVSVRKQSPITLVLPTLRWLLGVA